MNAVDVYAEVRDKPIMSLTPEQLDLAQELWLRNNYRSFHPHYWERNDALFPAVLRVIDRLRAAAVAATSMGQNHESNSTPN